MDSIATFLAECPLLYSPVACVRATHAASLTAIGICTYPDLWIAPQASRLGRMLDGYSTLSLLVC